MKVKKLFSDLEQWINCLKDDDNKRVFHKKLKQLLAKLQAFQVRMPEFENMSVAKLSSIRKQSVTLISELKETKLPPALFWSLKRLSQLCVALNEKVLRKDPHAKLMGLH